MLPSSSAREDELGNSSSIFFRTSLICHTHWLATWRTLKVRAPYVFHLNKLQRFLFKLLQVEDTAFAVVCVHVEVTTRRAQHGHHLRIDVEHVRALRETQKVS